MILMDLEKIFKLSTKERLDLIEKIWDSIETDSIQLTHAQKEELDNKLERHKSGKAKYYTWEEVKVKLAQKRKE